MVQVGQTHQDHIVAGLGAAQLVVESGAAEKGQRSAFGPWTKQVPDLRKAAEVGSVTGAVRLWHCCLQVSRNQVRLAGRARQGQRSLTYVDPAAMEPAARRREITPTTAQTRVGAPPQWSWHISSNCPVSQKDLRSVRLTAVGKLGAPTRVTKFGAPTRYAFIRTMNMMCATVSGYGKAWPSGSCGAPGASCTAQPPGVRLAGGRARLGYVVPMVVPADYCAAFIVHPSVLLARQERCPEATTRIAHDCRRNRPSRGHGVAQSHSLKPT